MAKICIMYPNNSTSVMLGHYLASELHHVAYYVPEQGPHELAAFTCVEEVKIASAGLDTTVVKLTSCKSLSTYDYDVFPLLDVDPEKPRQSFASMCRNLFK